MFYIIKEQFLLLGRMPKIEAAIEAVRQVYIQNQNI